MDINNLTYKTQEAIQRAHHLRTSYVHPQIEPEHVTLAILEQEEGVVKDALKRLGAEIMDIRSGVQELVSGLPTAHAHSDEVLISREAQALLSVADSERASMNDAYISVEHIMLAVIKTNSRVAEIFTRNKVTHDTFRTAIRGVRGSTRIHDQSPESKMNAIEKYTIDLTAKAQAGKLDPVIGRDQEIRRVMQVLSRRTKNNPVLIGEPGTGKTAIAEGLAQRIVAGDVPETLKNKRLVSLDLGLVLAGAKYRGEFEDRLKGILKAIEDSNGGIITFIDELHTIVGAGAAEGAVDASNLLKPALARGTLHAVGATTLKEYQKYIEKDAALERRFQPVYVGEPSVEDAVNILRGLKERYELHHGIKISDAAVVAAVALSQRYITDRFLPDKAIDLIDEATSSLKIEIDSMPAELDAIKRKKISLEISREALKKEKDPGAKETLKNLEGDIAALKHQEEGIEKTWRHEKQLIEERRTLSEKADQLRVQAQQLERQGELQKVAEIQYGKIPEIEKRVAAIGKKLAAIEPEKRILKEQVGPEEIARVVSRWTSIPVEKMLTSERDKLLSMEKILSARVIGQDDAVRAISKAVRRSRAGIAEESRPIGTFMFLGPTGVGKTEATKALAEFMFNSDDALIRIDMSEYMEKHAVARLIGSPPGYVGYDEGGQLTEAVRRRPYSVVLFDEIEKAHPDVFNVMLQILDEGRLTDAKGRTVNFKNTIIIMTSNLGSDIIYAAGGSAAKDIEGAVNGLLKRTFRPEFLNRIDEIIVFKTLRDEHIRKVAQLQLNEVARRLFETRRITVQFDETLIRYLARHGFDKAFGARPLKRLIQSDILDELAFGIMEGTIADSASVTIRVENDTIRIQ